MKRFGLGMAALTCLAIIGGGVMAGDKVVKVGDKVEKISSVDESGKPWTGEGILGKKTLVLYFYPADFTGGCTAQACSFRDDIEKLNSKSIVVVGVSGDSAATHAKFKEHHKLPFTLLADEKGDLAKMFGVKVSGGGKASFKFGDKLEVFVRGATTARTTVVIGADRTVLAIDTVKDAKGDSKRILELVK